MTAKDSEGQGIYRVYLDGDWQLSDLSEFPYIFEQCYAFIYCLDFELGEKRNIFVISKFVKYPWQGGYSYVHIYKAFRKVLINDKPRIKSIRMESPGWLDIFLNVEVAVQVAKSVGILAASGVAVTKSYSAARKIISELKSYRDKMKNDKLKCTLEQQKIIKDICEEMASCLGFDSLKDMHEKTQSPELTLKLLMAHYRKMDKLVRYIDEGKIELPGDLRKE